MFSVQRLYKWMKTIFFHVVVLMGKTSPPRGEVEGEGAGAGRRREELPPREGAERSGGPNVAGREGPCRNPNIDSHGRCGCPRRRASAKRETRERKREKNHSIAGIQECDAVRVEICFEVELGFTKIRRPAVNAKERPRSGNPCDSEELHTIFFGEDPGGLRRGGSRGK